MTDCFALLNEPRRPWLEAAEVRDRFHQLSKDLHPDRFHDAPEVEKERAGKAYAELNTACQRLCDPRERLLHLLELESGARPPNVQRIPPGTMDLFVEVGQICRDADACLAERAQVTSPLLKVQVFQRGLDCADRLNTVQQKVNAMRDSLVAELQTMNAAWASAPSPGSAARNAALPLERLEQIYRVFSYVSRWTEQIQERVVQLAM